MSILRLEKYKRRNEGITPPRILPFEATKPPLYPIIGTIDRVQSFGAEFSADRVAITGVISSPVTRASKDPHRCMCGMVKTKASGENPGRMQISSGTTPDLSMKARVAGVDLQSRKVHKLGQDRAAERQ